MKLFLFTTDLVMARQAEIAGIDSIIVDWENKGKAERQHGCNLEINADTPADVRTLARSLSIPVSVRVNSLGSYSADEVDCALNNGAKLIILPMARSAAEVRQFLSIVNRRAETMIQIETPELADQAEELNKLDWDYVYIGLNDLMVARGGSFIWEAVLDGTVETVCRHLPGRAYGFGGVTILGGGTPLPIELLLCEYSRLNCRIGFLRRAFKKEIRGKDIIREIRAVHEFISHSNLRDDFEKEIDHHKLLQAISHSMSLVY